MNAASRRRQVAIAGHSGDTATARHALADADATVRGTAIAALHRLQSLTVAELDHGLADPELSVRRRSAEVAATYPESGVAELLFDIEPTVIEVAAWACGEHETVTQKHLERLIELATGHDDALVREACVAALGAIGDEQGLVAVLAGCKDKPAIRRRAVLALAPFDGEQVDAAYAAALIDRDWQVRQAAEDLLEQDEREELLARFNRV